MVPVIEIVDNEVNGIKLLEYLDTNNVSHIEHITTNARVGFPGFQLSDNISIASRLNGSSYFFPEQGYQGFISSTAASDGYGISFHCSYAAQSNEELETIYISYDNVDRAFARDIFVRFAAHTVHYVFDEYKETIILNVKGLGITDGLEFYIDIVNWSASGKSFKITRISSTFVHEFSGSDIINFECSENLLDAQLSITPGICEQYADIHLYDRDGSLHYLVQKNYVLTDKSIVIKCVDSDGLTRYLGRYVIADYEITGESSEVSLYCKDSLTILKNLNLPLLPVESRSVHTMLGIVFEQANNLPWKYYDNYTEIVCKNVETPNSFFTVDTLYNTLQKICMLGWLRIYTFDNVFIVRHTVIDP